MVSPMKLDGSLDLDGAAELRRLAVERLEAAATAAAGAGANVEALRHLRAALELATPDRHLDLYERIGDTIVHGDTSIDALNHALGLARSSGASPDRVLRILSNILTFHTRWQGSVAGRLSEQELFGLFEEGRALLPVVSDEVSVARFRVAEAFLPFWISAGGREPTPAELAAADASAQEGYALASRHGDTSLQSAALDGIGGNAQQRGDYLTMASTARRRLEIGDRLDLGERIDATCMIVWADVTVGNLGAAAAGCEAGFRLVQPGQASNWALHMAAWWTLTCALSGDWDQANRAAERAHRLWIDLGRVAAGYATRGFLAAYEVARARHDDAGMLKWRETLDEINQEFGDSRRTELQQAVISGDAPTAAGLITHDQSAVGYDTVERVLSFISDRGIRLPDPSLAKLSSGTFPAARLLLAQLDRARGLSHGDEAALRAALAVFEQAGARPTIARLHVELGRLSGDAELVETGLGALRKLGDLDQFDRYGRAG